MLFILIYVCRIYGHTSLESMFGFNSVYPAIDNTFKIPANFMYEPFSNFPLLTSIIYCRVIDRKRNDSQTLSWWGYTQGADAFFTFSFKGCVFWAHHCMFSIFFLVFSLSLPYKHWCGTGLDPQTSLFPTLHWVVNIFVLCTQHLFSPSLIIVAISTWGTHFFPSHVCWGGLFTGALFSPWQPRRKSEPTWPIIQQCPGQYFRYCCAIKYPKVYSLKTPSIYIQSCVLWVYKVLVGTPPKISPFCLLLSAHSS